MLRRDPYELGDDRPKIAVNDRVGRCFSRLLPDWQTAEMLTDQVQFVCVAPQHVKQLWNDGDGSEDRGNLTGRRYGGIKALSRTNLRRYVHGKV